MRVPAWFPYVLPMAVYLGLSLIEPSVAGGKAGLDPVRYPIFYTFKFVATAAAAWIGRSAWVDLRARPRAGGWILSVALGLLVTVLWVALDGHYPDLPLQESSRAGFDPSVLEGVARLGFLLVRMLGLVLLVPVIEELFWRSFLIRWLIRPNFLEVPIGKVTWGSALITSVLFALAHPEWLPAFITGLLWVWLLQRTRSVLALVVSHAVSNLTLGLYILQSGSWRFW